MTGLAIENEAEFPKPMALGGMFYGLGLTRRKNQVRVLGYTAFLFKEVHQLRNPVIPAPSAAS